jgi:polyvinyl alcohol dehydrogenase (cytochrome)
MFFRPKLLQFAAGMIVILVGVVPGSTQTTPITWPISGSIRTNSRNQPSETIISRTTAKNLAEKWRFTTGGYVSATPTVDATAVYFPDSAGNLYALHRATGIQIWTHKMSDYTGVTGATSRVSPAVDKGHLFLGDQLGQSKVRPGTDVLSVDAATGKLLWITSVESHIAAQITGSPTVYNGIVYVGVSSGEEGLSESSTYACCTFRGSVVALDENTGKILWKTYDMPDNGGKPGGYSGGAIWSALAIDSHRGTLYVATGNNYSAPASVESCQDANPTEDCAVANDYFDSILSLDQKTGAIKWGRRLQGYDIYTLACKAGTGVRPNCPVPSSPDFDFGSGPSLVQGDLVGAGQKSGIYWALNADNGNIVWHTSVGPSGSLGGMIWGTATDDVRIYTAIANDHKSAYKLSSGKTITWGAYTALQSNNGQILWQTADPIAGTVDAVAPSVADGVVFTGSYSGHMYALNSANGQILWDFNSGGTVIDGPAIVNGTVYWGSGYHGPGTTNNVVYAFSIPGTSSD